jgi:hypothetical protein
MPLHIALLASETEENTIKQQQLNTKKPKHNPLIITKIPKSATVKRWRKIMQASCTVK